MTQPAPAGHNIPPDPIDAATEPYGDAIAEAESWLDGAAVETEGQMRAVDELLADIKAALKAVKAGQKSEAAPHHDAHKAALARWTPTIDDLTRIRDGLVAAGADFKRRKLAEQQAAERAAWKEANKARLDAEAAAQAASASDIAAQRDAAAAAQEAIDAEKAAQEAARGRVKGLRQVWRHEVLDYRAAHNWIAKNDRQAVVDFIDEYARRHHRDMPDSVVKSTAEKEAF